MQRSAHARRSDTPPSRAKTKLHRHKRPVTIIAVLLALAGVAAAAQVSFAGTRGRPPRLPAQACPTTAAPTAGPTITPTTGATTAPTTPAGTANPQDPAAVAAHNHTDELHVGDGAAAVPDSNRRRPGGNSTPGCTTRPSTGATGPTTAAPPGPQNILGNDCGSSRLEQHDGFQNGNRCVDTAFGEVADAANNPTLLITSSPQRVRVNQPFTMRVSTRNLVRDRFLPAGQGGYYKESSFLNEQGLVRGHFHSSCRLLSRRAAPDPAPVPAFFLATEDGRGGTLPDEVSVNVPGLTAPGVYQCAAWAGDGSHRIPMMARANQIPAFDAVRVVVTR